MKTYFYVIVLLLSTQFSFSQWTQLGADINGEVAGDWSGRSVSLSSDGSIVAIGAPHNGDNGAVSGHVRIYQFNGSGWDQLGTDIEGEAANNWSGWSVSLSSDGSIVAIGAIYNNGNASGHVRVYQFDGATWNQLGNDIDGEAAGDQSGYSVSLSSDGNIVAVGAHSNDGNGNNSGHVRIYEFNGVVWDQLGSDIDGEAAGDWSGYSVSLSSNGSIVAIGARYNDGDTGNVTDNRGHVRIYEFNGADWVQLGNDINGEAASDTSGRFINLNSDGSIVAIGAYSNDVDTGNVNDNRGHVRIYEFNGVDWVQSGNDIDGEAAGDHFGHSVSLNSDGNIIAIGAIWSDGNGASSGHVRVYEFDGANWVQSANDIYGEAAGDYFGFSVSLSSDGSRLAIGALHNDDNGADSGHVRVYNFPVPNTAVGEDSGAGTSSGEANVFIGYQSGFSNTTASRNVAVGASALYTQSYDNAVVSWNSNNTAIGFEALYSNQPSSDNSGVNNTAVGVQSLRSNTTGYGNTTMGATALYNNTTGAFNTAIGVNAMQNNINGNTNVALGNQTLINNTSGSGNIAIGYLALTNNTTGTANTAVGFGAGPTPMALAPVNNSTAIGNGATVTAAGQVRIGNAFVSSIGGYSPWDDLSDGRFKNEVKEDTPGLEFIKKLRPVSYELDRKKLHTFLTGKEAPAAATGLKERYNGFIAQEVEQMVEENGYAFWGVKKPYNEYDHYGIRYAQFVVPLVKGMQEQQDMIQAQQALIENLQQEIETLKNSVYGSGATNGNTQTKSTDSFEGFILYQNTPNPFDKTTVIAALIPKHVQQAKIIVYNLQGLELESYELSKRGHVSVEISAGRFPSGMYLYALIADDIIIDTKKMILTK